MCGFIAVLQSRPCIDIVAARRSLNAIAHRGPDAAGEWSDGYVFLGHRRLSIIDLATGDQPMQSTDGRYVIVFNGEIYNFIELRERLANEGACFRTRSDTEVILEGYRRWGAKVVERLHGMFAFVIWDTLRSSLFGARDRLGIKPLCWAMHNGALIVSSTIEPLTKLNGFESIDLIALRDLMTFDYILAPRTILDGVHKLEPGNRFEWSFGSTGPAIEPYWAAPDVNTAARIPDEYELEALLEHAVKRQMISDVPIGAFLSGGIDSSLLVALMARHSGTPVRTFSVSFAEEGFDESPIAQLVARRYGTNHTVLEAEKVDSEALLELLGFLDEPFCDPAFVPTYALSKLTRNHVKVALSGDGGDEVFGGYPKYRLGEAARRPITLSSLWQYVRQVQEWRPVGAARVQWWSMSPQNRIRFAWTRYGDFRVFRKDLRQLLIPAYHNAMRIEEFFEPWERWARRYGPRFDTDVLMRADLETYLSENNLVKTDRASMLASLEARVPYLDETVLDRILPLPAKAKIANGQLKALLMPIVRRLLPTEVWDRPKRGFQVPIGAALAGGWRPALEAVLDWGESHVDLFDYGYLRRLHKLNISGVEVWRDLWNPFVFLAWEMARSFRR